MAAPLTDPLTTRFAPAVSDPRRVPVDGALVLNRTRDDGVSFDMLSSGLPARGFFDLLYRHRLAVADDGCSLPIGNTTGGLSASAEGGEHGAMVSTLRPPFYAGRFG